MTQYEPSGRQAEIHGCFDGFIDIYPHKSKDFLLQMTANTMKCSINEVVAALHAYTVTSTHHRTPAE